MMTMYSITTPPNHPKKEELEKLAISLLEFLPIHSLYFSVNTDSGFKAIVTIFLSEECEMDAPSLVPFVARLFQSYPDFSFHLLEQEHAEEYWEEGHMFYMLHATRNELAYSADPSNTIFSLETNRIKKLLRRAKGDFHYYDTAANTYLGSVIHYVRNEDFLQAAFHLHQALEAIYVYLSKLTTGEYECTADLIALQRNFQAAAPTLQNLFTPENEQEHAVLEQLNNSFRAVKYNEEHTITKDAVDLARTKVEKIMKEAAALFKMYIKKCKDKIKAARHQAAAKDNSQDEKNNFKSGAMVKDRDAALEAFMEELKTFKFGRTLIPDDQKGNPYHAKVTFPSYVELQYTVRDMLMISIHSLYNEGLENSGRIGDPAYHLTRLLEVAVQLLPVNEMEILDGCSTLYTKLNLMDNEENGN